MNLKYKLLILTILITAVFGIFTIPGEKFTTIFYDDSFYYIDMVNNGSILHPSVGDNIPTTGYHPLWYWLLEIMAMFTGGAITALQVYILCMILFIGSFYIWGITLSRIFEKESYGFISSFITHFIPTMFLLMLSGMETALTISLLGFFVLMFMKYKEEINIKNAKWLAISTINVLLVRTDMALIIFPFFIWLFFFEKPYTNGWKKSSWIWLSGCILPIPLITLFFKLTGGTWFQISMYIYPNIRWEEIVNFQSFIIKLGESLAYLSSCIIFMGGFSIILLIMIGLCLHKYHRIIFLLFIGLIVHTFVHAVLRFHFANWYLAPYCIIFGYTIVLLYTIMSYKEKVIVTTLLIGSLILSILWIIPFDNSGHVFSPVFNLWDSKDRPLDQMKAINLIDQKGYPVNWKIGAFNSGKLAYLDDNKHHIVNLDGLMNSEIARLYQLHNKDSVYAYFVKNNINMIVDKDSYYRIFSRYIPMDSFLLLGEVKDSSNLERTPQKTLIIIRKGILDDNKTVPQTPTRTGEIMQNK
jgi:hypothetical protein